MTVKAACAVLAGALLVVGNPTSVAAAPVTVSIGSFAWDAFLGESFSLQNDSALFEGLQGDFTEVSLLLTPDYDSDGDGTSDPVFEAFPSTLSFMSGANSYNITVDGPLASAHLTFRFTPVGLPDLFFDQVFAGTDDPFFSSPFIQYSYERPDPEPEPEPVPEPASALLFGTVLGAAVAARRRLRM